MARSRYIQTVKEGRASYEDAPWHVRDGIVVGPPFASDPWRGAGGGVELGARRGTAGPVQKPVALSPLTSSCSRQRLRRTMSTFSSSVYAAASISSSLSRSVAGIPARSWGCPGRC